MQLCVAAVLLMASAVLAAPPFDHRPVLASVCDTMMPYHDNAQPMQGPWPYSVTVSTSSVNAGQTVRVHLSGSEEFKGVYLQARRENGEPVGEFLLPGGETEELFLTDCPPGRQNAFSYISYKTVLRTLDVDWKAPNIDENIVFRATFVKSYSVFWVGIESDKIAVKTSTSTDKAVAASRMKSRHPNDERSQY